MPKGENCSICLFDMDGTLFDYEKQLREDLAKLAAPEEQIFWDHPDLPIFEVGEIPHIKERINLIRNTPGWWRDLPRFQLGWDLYSMAVKLGYDIQICTKGPSSRPHAWQEKVECLRKHFRPEEITIHITEQKAGRFGRVLVDDYTEYAEDWLQWRKRGLAILPISNQNKDFKHPNAIIYDGSKESAWDCQKALEAASVRENKQHWQDTSVWKEWIEEKDGNEPSS